MTSICGTDCSPAFTQQELDDAADYLMQRQREFMRDDYVGSKLRLDTIDKFKREHSLKTDDPFMLHVQASLHLAPDIEYAVQRELLPGPDGGHSTMNDGT